MKLRDLIDGLADARVIGDAGVEIGAATVRSDSRALERGDVFVAVRGIRADGHAFVPVALERGAAAIVVEHEVPGIAIPQVIVPNGAVALGVLVARMLGDPAKQLTLVGVTGTNGKTTTTYLVESILAAAGHVVGVIGTVSYRWGTPENRKTIDAPYTTPTPQVLHETFATMLADGCTHVVMEVSSAALVMDRLAGIDFAVAAFSNLTQDHLDVHGTMEAYRDAKRLLFAEHLHGGTAVINVDDPSGDAMAAAAPGLVLRVTASQASGEPRDADIQVIAQESTVRGITATLALPGERKIEIVAKPLIGAYNVENLALAVGMAEALGIAPEAIASGIAALRGVPGRVERVPNDADLDIFVDYAHTPDALRNVLGALRPLTRHRLICVFGCGGDRDPTKRPKMGAAVTELADLAIVTSDNPRTEDPRAIIDQILPAVPRPFFVDLDRRVAIRAAIAEATPGDVVVIAGKGHEDYQILGTTKHHFDDREEASAGVGVRFQRTVDMLAADIERGPYGRLIDVHGDRSHQVSRVVIDSRIVAAGDLYVAIEGETHDGHQFCAAAVDAGAAAVLVSEPKRHWAPPGRRLDGSEANLAQAAAIVVDDTRLAIGSIAHAHRARWIGKLVAITGSAGKTTTKELTRAALSAAGPTHGAEGSLNNETGVPLTLLGLRGFHAFGVVEMGMRGAKQIEYLTTIAVPDVAVVVNAGSAHIELLGSTDAIAHAKAEIWMGLRAGGTVVRPVDDPRLERLAREHRPDARHLTFGEAGSGPRPDVQLVEYTPLDAGGRLALDVLGARHELTLGLIGRHAAIVVDDTR
nr:UDP-N-acetylmuramoyl-L-alanyl-D-glutamate--2,6-diaminopimelate ligase [Deltaproteobacteria bacterium]